MAKRIRQQNLDERIDSLKAWIKTLINIRDTEPKTVEELVCKKYVEFGNVREVKEFLDGLCYKFTFAMISDVIDKADIKTNVFATEAKRMLKEGRKICKR